MSSFRDALEQGWREDLLRRYQQGPEGWRVSSTFGRKVQCLHPEWTTEDLTQRIREDPLLQLALTPEPVMTELFPRVQQAYVEARTGWRLERLPKIGKGSVALSSDGSIAVGWRDYCSTRPFDYSVRTPEGMIYIFVYDVRADPTLTERDLSKFRSCASRVSESQLRLVLLVEDAEVSPREDDETQPPSYLFIGSTDAWIASVVTTEGGRCASSRD